MIIKYPKNFRAVLHSVFNISILIKGFNGLWETASGLLLLTLSRHTFHTLFRAITYNELVEDPRDHIIVFLNNYLRQLSVSTKIFVGSYMLFHGLMNLFLAIQLYRQKLWAYQAAIIAISIFIGYQIIRIFMHHSVILALITVLDIVFVYVTLVEYKNRQKII